MGILAVDSIKSRTVAPVTISDDLSVTGVSTYTGAITASGGIVGDVTGTATTATNATGLTGSPSITVTDVGANDVNATGVGTFGSVVSGAISGSTGTFTGDIDIADKIVHTGDTDTAIRFSAADTVTVETGGTNRITVNNNASVNTLDVAGGARADFFVGRSNQSAPTADASIYRAADNTLALATSSTERLRIGSSGEIGIAGANYGTSGQVLTSAGSGSAVSWADVSAGIWSTITSGTASGSTSNITTNGITSSYDMYKIVFSAWFSTAGQLGIDITTDGGSTWTSDATGWTYSTQGRESNTNWGSDGSGQSAGWLLPTPRNHWWGEITFVDTQNSGSHPSFNFVGGVDRYDTASHGGTIISNQHWPNATTFNGIRWYSSTAAITSCKWVLLGTTLS